MARTTIRSEDIADSEITSAKIADSTVVAADVADDSITNAKIKSDASIAATKLAGTLDLSSKTVTLPAASVTAHVTQTDLSPVRNDIATLALHSAIADNKAAYNLSNSFIDQFEDSTGIDATSTTIRDTTSEYVWCATASSTETLGYNDSLTIAYSTTGGSTHLQSSGSYLENNSLSTTYGWYFIGGSGIAYLIYDMTKPVVLSEAQFHSFNTAARPKDMYLEWSSDNSSWTEVVPTGVVSGLGGSISGNKYTADNTDAWKGITFSALSARYWRWRGETVHNNGNNYAGISETKFPSAYYYTVSSSGNYTSTTEASVASVSSMGIVVLYKDASGTASLNTDLIAQVSANGGTNYSNATLVAGGTFSTGIKIAAVSGVSVTAGTTPKYKISFANQSAGSKETQIHGVALLY